MLKTQVQLSLQDSDATRLLSWRMSRKGGPFLLICSLALSAMRNRFTQLRLEFNDPDNDPLDFYPPHRTRDYRPNENSDLSA